MKILHVFQENKTVDRKAHIKALFGVIPITGDQYNPDDQSYIVCYCGGRLYNMGEGEGHEWVGAVWHLDAKRHPEDEATDEQ